MLSDLASRGEIREYIEIVQIKACNGIMYA